MSASAQIYDVVIVGAGLAGATLACTLTQLESKRPLRIAVVEAGGEASYFVGDDFDPRVVALTHSSQKLLQSIDCWAPIVAERVCPYREMNVWDGEGTAAIHFSCDEVRATHLGHIVENSLVVRTLRNQMHKHPQIHLLQPATVTAITKPEPARNLVQVTLDDGSELHTALLVAADGGQSAVRDLAGFATREWDYGQQAIVTSVRTEKVHEFTAWQRFMHSGPLAFLPLQNDGNSHYCSIVWSADTPLAQELMALSDEDFCARLGRAFEYRLGNIEACAERFCIPLQQRHARTYMQPGIVLIGDAAHTIHPLAGQGVNLGLLDVAALKNEIQRALARDIPLHDLSILRRYQRQRLGSNLAMMSAMEGFKQLFGNRSLLVNLVRNTGMRGMNALPAVKNFIVKQVMG